MQRLDFETLASGYALVEGPTWAPDGSLFWSDVLGGGVYRRTPDGVVSTAVPKRRGVGGIALHADGGLVLGGRDLIHVKDGITRALLQVEGLPGWNDLCSDARGRVWAGSVRFRVFDPEATPVPGECWRVDAPGVATPVYAGVLHANGIALSPDERWLVHSDTRQPGALGARPRRGGPRLAAPPLRGRRRTGRPRLRRGGLRLGRHLWRRASRSFHARREAGPLARGSRAPGHEPVLRGIRPARAGRGDSGQHPRAFSARLRAAHAPRRRGRARSPSADLALTYRAGCAPRPCSICSSVRPFVSGA